MLHIIVINLKLSLTMMLVIFLKFSLTSVISMWTPEEKHYHGSTAEFNSAVRYTTFLKKIMSYHWLVLAGTLSYHRKSIWEWFPHDRSLWTVMGYVELPWIYRLSDGGVYLDFSVKSQVMPQRTCIIELCIH